MSHRRPSHAALGIAAALLAVSALSARAAGTVEVVYIEPEKFADVGRGAFDRERTLKAMTEFLQDLGATLPDGQTLKLEVTEFDLAGEILPWGRGQELRVMGQHVDWPHLALRYTLQSEGRTLKAGEANLTDMNYLMSLRPRDQGELAYEKRMVRTWFEATIVAH
jgi:hypothetical protein